MFSLTQEHRYLVYSKPVDMRNGFNGLQGIVQNKMGMDVRSGDVFVFFSSNMKMMKLLHREKAGLVIYSLRLDYGRIKPPVESDGHDGSIAIDYMQLKSMILSALDSPYVRQLRLAAACFKNQQKTP